MDSLENRLKWLRDVYDKRDDKIIEQLEKSQENNETLSSIQLAKHNLLIRIVEDLDDIIEEYF